MSKEEIACEKHWLALLFCAAGSFEGNCATWLTYIQPKIFHLSPSMGPNVAKVVWQSNESSIYVCLVSLNPQMFMHASDDIFWVLYILLLELKEL